MRTADVIPFLFALAAAAAQVPTAPLSIVVVDPQGNPVAGAPVTVERGLGRGFACLDLELAHTWIPLDHNRTDSKGRLGLQLPIGLSLRVEVDQKPFARWRSEDVVPGDELRIELQPACTFRGRLVLAGAGTEGKLRAWHPQTHVELFDARTNADGSFVFDRLPPGPFCCDVSPDAAVAPRWLRSFLGPDAPLQHDFVLEPGTAVRGKVVDAATGEPIAGARIGEGWTLHKRVVSGEGGAFELLGYGDPGRRELRCEAVGYRGQQVAPTPGAAPLQQVDFRLERGIAVTGHVVDPSGAPRAGVYVAAVSAVRDSPWVPART
ncbi:MAG: hypothetical protein KDC48_15440, partial [Planctomycetes bacterium]|nr:hypothetical protein [Planctomycetota bacterium]